MCYCNFIVKEYKISDIDNLINIHSISTCSLGSKCSFAFDAVSKREFVEVACVGVGWCMSFTMRVSEFPCSYDGI